MPTELVRSAELAERLTVLSRNAMAFDCPKSLRTQAVSSYQTEQWIIQEVSVVSAPTQPPPSVVAPSVPPNVENFIRRLTQYQTIKCVVVEEVAENEMQITTFAAPLDDDVREAVYNEEMALIDTSPRMSFDFHLRNAEEVGSTPTISDRRHLFAIWGALDAE